MEENEEEGLKIIEDGLKMEIIELKGQIEENQLVYGIPTKGMRQMQYDIAAYPLISPIQFSLRAERSRPFSPSAETDPPENAASDRRKAGEDPSRRYEGRVG